MFFRTELKRAFISFRFFAACLIYGILLCLNYPNENYNSAALNFYIMYNAGFLNMFFICSALPHSGSYAIDTKNGLFPYAITRIGAAKYSIAKILTTCISAFAVTTIGSVILVLFLLTKAPLRIDFFVDFWGYDTLLGKGQYLQYFLVRIILASSIGSAFAVIGLFASTFNEKEITAIISPIVIYYAYNELINWGIIPKPLNVTYLLFAPINSSYEIYINVIYVLFISFSIISFLGFLFTYQVRRKEK